ncbi:MAG: hypothetical protein JNM80_02255 [Phycisphaerae bacterium]|nr:hypothetical protein [Phycisphaerae bacterium]
MSRPLAFAPCVLVVVAAAPASRGQVVFDKVRVNEPQGSSPVYYGETAIALSRTNPNEFIAAVLCGHAPSCNMTYMQSPSASA